MIKSFPNILSWCRIVLAPVIAVAHFAPGYGPTVAWVLFIVAAVSDYLDGKIARDFSLSSPFGIFLDPVADKILVVVVLLTLVASAQTGVDRNLLTVFAALIILRELVQSSLRDWMAQAGRAAAVGVTYWSKLKTVLQLVGLGTLLAHSGLPPLGFVWPWVGPLGAVLIGVAAVLGVLTLVQFMRIAWGRPAQAQQPQQD